MRGSFGKQAPLTYHIITEMDHSRSGIDADPLFHVHMLVFRIFSGPPFTYRDEMRLGHSWITTLIIFIFMNYSFIF